MIPCPACKGHNVRSLTRRKRPVVTYSIVVRWHECSTCGHRFRSYQLAVDSDLMADALIAIASVA